MFIVYTTVEPLFNRYTLGLTDSGEVLLRLFFLRHAPTGWGHAPHFLKLVSKKKCVHVYMTYINYADIPRLWHEG